jgi:threonine synthase
MRYISTRGHSCAQRFCDIVLEGLAPDGGLYVPETYPQVSAAQLAQWRTLSYAQLAFEILRLFIDDIPEQDLRRLTEHSYTPQVYRYSRDPQRALDITPLTRLQEDLYLLELSNGPTLAFKDMAMQLLGNLFEWVLSARGQTLNILGATSGDTGSAAEYALRGKHGVRVFMLSPHGKMSDFQRAQMFALQERNIFNLAITGMFDDCQDIVKAVSNDAGFKTRYRIGAVNSINWARIVAQVVYYFKGWFAATKSEDEEVAFCVPSGNFGNICAGHIARMMGLPIARLVLATNENDVLDEFFRTGHYRPRSANETHVTSSPSMDISKASNVERFVFDWVERDVHTLKTLWRSVDAGAGFDLSGTPAWARLPSYRFASGRSDHADRIETIGTLWRDQGFLIDPHTADALKVAQEHRQAGVGMVVLETAQPVKFAATIREAIGIEPPRHADFAGLEDRPQRVTVLAPDVRAVQSLIASAVGGERA